MLKLRNETIQVSRRQRCADSELVNFITNLKLNAPPENSTTSNKGTFQELEQYLTLNFPKYTFGFKQNVSCAQPALVSSPDSKPYIITEDKIFFPRVTSVGLKQPNLFLLVVSESKSLIEEVTGKQSYLILKCVEAVGKVKLVEVDDNYLSSSL